MAQAHRTPQPRAAPSQPRVFKLVLLGSGSVGKSSLALRCVLHKGGGCGRRLSEA
ncbi:RAB17 isoform 7 [Pan troglodytes]|uniref:RAB17 isoform 7 n=1 Tax=Pan troglodytes TaxID=9598 RepID=A0A2J8JQ21_PANTR|nr:RAB17 isoform 7 [Pan troglodytes]